MMLDKEGENINWIRGFRLLVSIAIFFVSVILHGQGEGANWYFGNNAGINFNAGSVNSLSDGGLKTNEGCATISNSKGELLFYTDGITVWDKNHNIMPNGQGLLGDPSSTQSAIIVPKPNSETIYYIFTVINGGRVEGLRYSEVDLTLNNGNGDVSSNKNVLLMTPCTEKISAVKHANGSDYWVATHNWNSSDFTVFKITENGVEMSPVISPGVSFHGGHPYSGIGYMKFSPNGKKIALARWSTDSLVEVFDFDSNTGVISNPIVIDSAFGADFENGAYGIEFSPNSELLYVSEIDLRSYLSKLHQFNLSIYTKTDIINSKVLLYQGRNLISALQLALDGKIYLCRTFTSYLDAIETPNAIGLSSSYISRVVDLQGRRNVYGLPTFIQSLFVAKIEANNLCSNNSSQFSLKTDESVNSVLWDFGDRESSSLKNPNHTYKTSGAYTVEAKINTGYSIISITKDIVVYESPIANKATDYLVCGNVINDGFESFDLNTKTPEILGGQLGSDFEVSYFESHEDATDNIGALPITYTSDINNQVIYARIQNRLNSDCYDISSFLLKVETKLAGLVEDLIICDDKSNDGKEIIDLRQFNAQVASNYPVIPHFNCQITYHLTQAQAISGVLALSNNFETNSNNQDIYARIENTNTGCFDTTHFKIIINETLMAHQPDNMYLCDDASNDSKSFFNLKNQTLKILNTQTGNVTYYLTQSEADAGINPLPENFENQTNPQQLFVRAESIVNASCYDTTSFYIKVNSLPVVGHVDDLTLCDDVSNDGKAIFNLQAQTLNTQTGKVTYHLSQSDADSGLNAIAENFENQTNPQQLFIRAESLVNASCYDTASFYIEVNTLPIAGGVADLILCDDRSNDGTEIVDLAQFDASVYNGASKTDNKVSYHLTESEANTGTGGLPNSFETKSNDQALYARLENSATGCFTVAHFKIIINETLTAHPPKDMYLCDDVSNDGKAIFNLQPQASQIFKSQTGKITYHISQSDADSGLNAIAENFENQANPQELFIRVESLVNASCYDTTSFYIGVNSQPVIDMDVIWYLCPGEDVQLYVNSIHDEYIWNTGETSSEIIVDEPGDYKVTVYNINNDTYKTTCSVSRTIKVVEPDFPKAVNIEINDWTSNSNSVLVHVDGTGHYEYSIDDYDYQDSNFFNDLLPGDYTVYVKNENGCIVYTEDIYLLNYPKFFTPNSDGYNDFWKINFSETEPDIEINIFDRYGKLITQLNPLSNGWDGTLNGQSLATSDYWFVVVRPSKNKQYSGHFTLKR